MRMKKVILYIDSTMQYREGFEIAAEIAETAESDIITMKKDETIGFRLEARDGQKVVSMLTKNKDSVTIKVWRVD